MQKCSLGGRGSFAGTGRAVALPDLRNEIWLAKRVYGRELCTLFSGVTDVAVRCHRMRSAILGRGLADVGEGRANFKAMFERLYGEPL